MPMRRTILKQVIIGALVLLSGILMPVDARVNAQETASFSPGDVFAAIADGKANWYSSQGNLIKTLDTGLGGATAGMAFDKDGNLYLTNFDANAVSKFDTRGNLLGTFGSDFGDNPESIVFDKLGNVYVGHAGAGPSFFSSPDVKLRKFDAAGNLIDAYDLQTDERGSDWIDLAADQCVFFYTSEGQSVLRYDVCANQQLPALTKDLHGNAFALRILGDGGVLVADRRDIHRLDEKGNIVNTYDVAGEELWFALNRDPDGKSFWSGSMNTGSIYKFDIVSGEVLMGPIHACDADSCLGGLAVYGELTEAINPGVTVPFLFPAIPWYLWLLPLALLPVFLLWRWLNNRSGGSRGVRQPTRRDGSSAPSGKSVKPEISSKSGADVHHGKNTPKIK